MRNIKDRLLVIALFLSPGCGHDGGEMTISLRDVEPDEEAPSSAQMEFHWRPAAPMLEARAWHTALSLDDSRVVVMGGASATSDILNSVEIYDIALDKWTQAEPMTIARYVHEATLLPDGRVLVTGGILDSKGPIYSDKAEIFDPIARCGWTWSGPIQMHSSHTAHTVTILPPSGDGTVRGIVVGGRGTFDRDIAERFEYHKNACDLSENAKKLIVFEAYPDAPKAYHGHTATQLPSGELLIAGGYDPYAPLAQASRTIPFGSGEAALWTPIDTLPDGRSFHSATLLTSGSNQGKVLIAGGRGLNNLIYQDTLLFDPSNNQVGIGPIMRQYRGQAQSAWIEGQWVLMGGYGSLESTSSEDDFGLRPTATVEVYDPKQNTFRELADMREPRVCHAATPFLNIDIQGTQGILVTGGMANSNSVLNSAEILVPEEPIPQDPVQGSNDACMKNSDCPVGMRCNMYHRCVPWE